jgi:hypothetical protein
VPFVVDAFKCPNHKAHEGHKERFSAAEANSKNTHNSAWQLLAQRAIAVDILNVDAIVADAVILEGHG